MILRPTPLLKSMFTLLMLFTFSPAEFFLGFSVIKNPDEKSSTSFYVSEAAPWSSIQLLLRSANWFLLNPTGKDSLRSISGLRMGPRNPFCVCVCVFAVNWQPWRYRGSYRCSIQSRTGSWREWTFLPSAFKLPLSFNAWPFGRSRAEISNKESALYAQETCERSLTDQLPVNSSQLSHY